MLAVTDSARPYFLVGLLSQPPLLKVIPPLIPCASRGSLAGDRDPGHRGRFSVLPVDARRFLLCDASSNVVFLVNPSLREKHVIAGCGKRGHLDGPLEICRMDAPAALVLDPHTQHVYVADRGNHCVRKLDLACGLMTTVCGNGVQGNRDSHLRERQCLDAPFGLSFSEPHFLLVSCADNSVRRYDTKTGGLTTILIGS